MRIEDSFLAAHPRGMPRRAVTPPDDPLGRRLFYIRKALNFEYQNDFARELGVEPQTYNPWEKGVPGRVPSHAALERLKARHDIPPEYILYDVPHRLPHHIAVKLIEYGVLLPLPGPATPKKVRKPRR